MVEEIRVEGLVRRFGDLGDTEMELGIGLCLKKALGVSQEDININRYTLDHYWLMLEERFPRLNTTQQYLSMTMRHPSGSNHHHMKFLDINAGPMETICIYMVD